MDTYQGLVPRQLFTSGVRSLPEDQFTLCWSHQPLGELVCPEMTEVFGRSIYDPSQRFQNTEPVVLGYAPRIADAAILRAAALGDPQQKVGIYVLPQNGLELFLLARDPQQLKDRRGWVQVVSRDSFVHFANDPEAYPLRYMYTGTQCLPVIQEYEVCMSDLQAPVACVPEEIALDQVLMETSAVRRQGETLVISYRAGHKKDVILDLYRFD